ncbi:MAG: hypothetical protein MUP90_10195 [Gammaproteobacteria bacterium]|nr:hypothetical protein [Gammaproteobacteria bacterium]
MSVMKRMIGEMAPGFLMLVLVLAGVASGEASQAEQVAEEVTVDMEVEFRDVAGQFAIQVLSGAGAILSSASDLGEDGALCRSEDRVASSERQQRSF